MNWMQVANASVQKHAERRLLARPSVVQPVGAHPAVGGTGWSRSAPSVRLDAAPVIGVAGPPGDGVMQEPESGGTVRET